MVTDVQGWRVDKGKYMLTDPIVFSSVPDKLGLVDWGQNGMEKWLKLHKCNSVCNQILMKEDKDLIRILTTYLEKFASKNENFQQELTLILG